MEVTVSVEVGNKFGSEVLLTDREIIEAARFIGDENQIHHNPNHKNPRVEGLIASGSHFSGVFSALVPSYFSKYGHVLGLDMSFQFRSPILAKRTYKLTWIVMSKAWNAKLNGTLFGLNGEVTGPSEKIVMTGKANVLTYD